MAVLALGFVGQAIGAGIGGSILGVTSAAIGGFIGSTIGSLLDNMLFGGNKVEGPRLSDRRVMASTYGRTIPRLYGPENRLACDPIWSTELIETEHTSGGKGVPSVEVTEYTYAISAAFLIGDGRTAGLQSLRKIYANAKLIYDADGTGSPPVDKVIFDSVTFYPGDGVQNPDPTIESYLGVGNVPAYRHSAYFVIENLQLADFGNRLPNIEAVVEADSAITVGEVCADLLGALAVDLNQVSTGSLPDSEVRGYLIAGQSRGADALQPLALVYGFDVAEQGGNLRFKPRGRAPNGILTYGDLGATEGPPDGSEPAEPVRFALMPVVGLPKEAIVTHMDPARDYQPNAQPSRRQFGDPESNLSYDVPIVIDADTARQVADRMMFESDIGRRTAGFESNERARYVLPGDVWLIESPAGLTRVRITRLLRGANRVYQFESREDDPTIYESNARGIAAAIPPQVIEPVGDTALLLIDSPLLRDSDDDTGFYFVGAGELTGWRGGFLKRSTDGVTYFEVSPIGRNARLGTVAGTLASGPVDVWDRVNTLSVQLDRTDFQLESVSEAQALAGLNAAWLGDPADPSGGEVFIFETATLTGPGQYTLSNLIRGRAGTEFAVGLHSAGERFALLDRSLLRADFGPADWNKVRNYKGVSLLQSDADASAQTFTNTGEGKRPLAPVHVRGTRDTSNNLTLTWVRRSRFRQPGLGNGNLPLGEAAELYSIDILSGATVVRTIAATSPTASYTAAQQTADGLTPGAAVSLIAYQVSDVRGRGHGAAALV